MTALLVALLLALVLPLFLANWRISLLGLAAQGVLMGCVSLRVPEVGHGLASWVTLVDLLLVRGLCLPWLLWRVLRAQHGRARHDLIPPDLLSWAAAIALLFLAFQAADVLAPVPAWQHLLVAVVIAGVLLGFLVLATQAGVFAQVVGAMRIENAIALLELGGDEPRPAGLAIAHLVLAALTIAAFAWYVNALPATAVAPAPDQEVPV